jgi:hypothetical protein
LGQHIVTPSRACGGDPVLPRMSKLTPANMVGQSCTKTTQELAMET